MRPPKVTFIERSQSPEKEDPIMIQAPQVNLNGTSKESLMEQVRNAADACYNLQAQLADMRPHGRDYQTAPEGPTSEHAQSMTRGRPRCRACWTTCTPSTNS